MAKRDRAPVDENGEPLPRGSFFTWLAGADPETLAAAPRERHKFTGVGGVVLMTAVLAATSFTFALFTAVRVPIYFAIPLGLAWGLGIMNLDRWLVTATPRRPRWYQNLVLALPRLFLALIIGVVISTPMVLWIFQREINAELVTIHQQNRAAFEQQLAADKELSRIPTDQQQVIKLQAIVAGTDASVADPTSAIQALTKQKLDAFNTWQLWQNRADCERDGAAGCGGTGLKGKGPNWHDDEERAAQYKTVYDQTSDALTAAQGDHKSAIGKEQQAAQTNLQSVNQDLTNLLAQKNALIADNNAQVAADNGLLARLDALSKLTGTNSTLRSADIALGLLFIMLEIMPVLAKFLMNIGEESLYDKALRVNDAVHLEAAHENAALRNERRRAVIQEYRRNITKDAEATVNNRRNPGAKPTASIPNPRLDEGEGDVFMYSTIGSGTMFEIQTPPSAPQPKRRRIFRW